MHVSERAVFVFHADVSGSRSAALSRKTMKFGIVASEFPPAFGGMQQHALGIARSLADSYEVTVYTSDQHRDHRYDLPFEVRPVLQKQQNPDFDEIAAANLDAILTLNAGYAPLATHAKAPVFCYCHGNDFLNPWIDTRPAFLEGLFNKAARKVVFSRRYKQYLRRIRTQRNISRGLDKARAIFVNSSYTRAKLAETFPSLNTQIYTSPPCVSDHMFGNTKKDRKETKIDDPLQIITIARLARAAKMKNVDNVLRALSIIKQEIPFQCTIIGDGDLRDELEELASNLGLSERAQFLGTRPNSEIPAWLDKSDLFVLPSVESFGIVYVEAAARGIPSLALRAGGAADAVADGITGIIIDSASAEDIADGIRRFWRRRDRFDPNAIRGFAEQFRWEHVAMIMKQKIEEHINI